jgi:hypothetical protein
VITRTTTKWGLHIKKAESMTSPSLSVRSFADDLAYQLRVLRLGYDDPRFYPDPLVGKCRTIGRWRFQPRQPLWICVYTGSYFQGRSDCWVGFGARNPSSVELLKSDFSAGTYVELASDDWTVPWSAVDNERKEALVRTAFTAFEDWRASGGWVWFGRYFKSDQSKEATAFLRSVIQKPRSSVRSSETDRETETTGNKKIRIGQDDFRSEQLERWGRTCALTGCGVVDLLEAAHIVPWAKNQQ